MVEFQLFNRITTNQPSLTPVQMRAYWGELDLLLARIESASDPYDVLGVERTASYEEIWYSYKHQIALLYPSYSINCSFPEAMQNRIERVFARISRAFAVLASAGRRRQFDESGVVLTDNLNPAVKTTAQPPLDQERLIALAEAATRIQELAPAVGQLASAVDAPLIAPDTATTAPEAETAASNFGKYPRRFPRFKMRMPVQVTGYSRSGSVWQEAAETGQISRQGALVRMRQRVRHGHVLHLTMPLPLKLRSYSFADTHYKAYAIVRSVIPRGDGVRDVGLEFLGKNPPAGYFDKPWNYFRTESWKGAERRRIPRFRITEQIQLDFFTDTRMPLSHCAGVTETLSRGGACVRVAAMPDEFDLVGVNCAEHGFESLAVVTNRFAGQDGQERLCLQFIEQQWPI
ncbi:MAG: PilZ domain-containing protein [Blastocatellia bacterium]